VRAVDLFAGLGGFTEGAQLAGVDVAAALNHWQAAVDMHRANHPGTRHDCQDLHQYDFAELPRFDLLLASPACQGHSYAGQPSRGDRRVGSHVRGKHDADRNTAWAVITCAEVTRPRVILVENVKPFRDWPLFQVWTDALRALGYTVRVHLFDAADFGVPQNRKRLIVTAGLAGAVDLVSPELEPVPFGPCIDWKAGKWHDLASKPAGVHRRVDAARARGLGRRFLVHYGWSGHKGRELDRPIGCITTKVQWAAVDGDRIRMLSAAELRRGMGFREDYQLPDVQRQAVRMLGNAIPPPFAAQLIEQAVAA
jgi:DNA (cytosine-5)-methyltransferase 1